VEAGVTATSPRPAPRGLVWRLEWQRALARRRLLLLNILIPFGLVLPLALSDAPRHHAAAVFAVLFTLFGTFGATIPALRDAEQGLLRRLTLTPIGARGLFLERALAGACLDALQLLPALALIAWSSAIGPLEATVLGLVLAFTLAFANLFGLWLAAFARSVAEGALFAAVAALLLLHASGVFRSPAADTMGARIEAVAPFRALHETLLSPDPSGLPPGGLALLAGLALMIALTVVAAPRLVRSMRRADGR
jgi:hypothetical protein